MFALSSFSFIRGQILTLTITAFNLLVLVFVIFLPVLSLSKFVVGCQVAFPALSLGVVGPSTRVSAFSTLLEAATLIITGCAHLSRVQLTKTFACDTVI